MTEYRITDKQTAMLDGYPVTLFSVYERNDRGAYAYAGRFAVDGLDQSDRACIDYFENQTVSLGG